jgi:hypothetical protein
VNFACAGAPKPKATVIVALAGDAIRLAGTDAEIIVVFRKLV